MENVSIRQRQEHARLLLPVGQLPVAVAVVDRNMDCLAASPAWIEIDGRDPAAPGGQNFFNCQSEAAEPWQRVAREILAKGETLHGEDAWTAADGRRKWLKWAARPWRDERGDIQGIIFAAEDISTLKKARQELETTRAAAERASRLLSEAVASIPQGFVIFDPDDRLLLCNEAYLRCYESSRDLLVPGVSFEEIVRHGAEHGQYPQAAGRLEAWIAERLAIHRAADGKPFEQHLDDGRWLLVMEFRTPSGCVVGNRIDITERKRAEDKLRQSAMVIAGAQEGIVITDRDGFIVEANPAFSRITEYSEDELRDQHIRLVQSGRYDRGFYREMWDSINTSGGWQGEIWNRRKGGEVYLQWLSISPLRDAAGRITNYVGISTDLSRMKHAQTELERLAHHDPLTKLPNRLLLASRLEHAISRVRRNGGRGAVLFIDLDRFKAVNDTLGHQAGDDVLKQIARRLRRRLRDSDTLARLGGDEFVVVLDEIGDDEAAAQVAADLIDAASEPIVVDQGQTVHIGASIGMAFFPQDADDVFGLIGLADQALYEVKKLGGGRCQVSRPCHSPRPNGSPQANPDSG